MKAYTLSCPAGGWEANDVVITLHRDGEPIATFKPGQKFVAELVAKLLNEDLKKAAP